MKPMMEVTWYTKRFVYHCISSNSGDGENGEHARVVLLRGEDNVIFEELASPQNSGVHEMEGMQYHLKSRNLKREFLHLFKIGGVMKWRTCIN